MLGGLPESNMSLLLPVQCPWINSSEFQDNFLVQQFSSCIHRAQLNLEEVTVYSSHRPSSAMGGYEKEQGRKKD